MAAPDRLRELRADVAAQLAAHLLSGNAPMPELRELQERLKMLDGALAEQGARNQLRPAIVLWPVMLVVSVLLVAASVPVPNVPLTLEVQASSVTLGLPSASVLGAQSINGELRIEGFTSLESPDSVLAGTASRERADKVIIQSDQTWLRALKLPAGARLTVQTRGDMTSLLVESPRSPVVAEVEVRGKTTLRLGDAETALERSFGHSEWLRLVGGDAARTDQRAPPMTLWLPRRGDSMMPLDGLRPGTLVFSERREGSDTVSAVGSSLNGGTLSLPTIGQTLRIDGGEWLEMDGLVVERFELIAGAVVLLKLSGSARVLRLKVGAFERSLKPSWLEHISRHHLVNLLWGSAALLWGSLAWVRKNFSPVLP